MGAPHLQIQSHQHSAPMGMGAGSGSGTPTAASTMQSHTGNPADLERIYQLVADMENQDLREKALLELSKKREQVRDLAPVLWHSFGTVACLLQEIVGIYRMLNPPSLTA